MKLETAIGMGITIAIIAFLLGALLAKDTSGQTIPEVPPPIVVTTDGPWVVMTQEDYRETHFRPAGLNQLYRYESKPSVMITFGGQDFRLDCKNNEAAAQAIADIKQAASTAANYTNPQTTTSVE